MIITFLGAPRTATTSYWLTLQKHKEVAPSKEKELFNVFMDRKIHYMFPVEYLKRFKIKDNTKVILDGTPAAYFYSKDDFKKIDMEKRIIYLVRNPFDRIYSTIKHALVVKFYEKPFKHTGNFPPYIDGNDLKLDRIIDFIPQKLLDSKILDSAYEVGDKIHLVRFDNANIADMFRFMGVEPIDVYIKRKYNSLSDIWDGCKEKNILDDWWNRNLDKIAKIVLADLHKVNKRIDVGDWISETENILFNV